MDKKAEKKKKKKPYSKAFVKAKEGPQKRFQKKDVRPASPKRPSEYSSLAEITTGTKTPVVPAASDVEKNIPEEPQSAQAYQTYTVSNQENTVKKSSGGKKKAKLSRTFEEICVDLSSTEAKNSNTIDRYVSLLQELAALKNLTPEQVQFFFASVNELIEDSWSPFLAKVAIHVNPAKMGTENLIAIEVIKCCYDILESCGLSSGDMEQACISFCESKDASYITDYLQRTEMAVPTESTKDSTLGTRKITPQELACVSFICFNFAFREFSPSSLEPLVRIDRAIAEYFSNTSLKDHAGKTLGSVLGSKVFSVKKITELVYLYEGTTETIQRQAKHINVLKDEGTALRARIAVLTEEVARWKGDHADLVAKIEALEAENARYCQERTDAESMLEYERNKFERQMQSKEAGIAEQLADDIDLEIQAIRETIEYVDEGNKKRIRRRLQRIDDILHEFGGAADA